MLGAALFCWALLPWASRLPGTLGWIASFYAVIAVPVAMFALVCCVGLVLKRCTQWAVVVVAISGVTIGVQIVRSSSLSLPTADHTSTTDTDLRVMVLNASPTLQDLRPLFDEIDRWNPDLVVFTEASAPLAREARRGSVLPIRYPFVAVQSPTTDLNGWILVLSKTELFDIDRSAAGMVAARVAIDEVRYSVVGFYAASPRTSKRWHAGNKVVDTVATFAQTEFDQGRAVVALGDLNATRASERERRIRSTDALGRAKPLLRARGSFPSGWPSLITIAIDDAWLSPDLEATTWTTLPSIGSDHRLILVDLRRRTPHQN